MTWNIKDRTVLVTGGNSGIGRATVEGFVGLGADVVMTARDQRRGDVAADEIADATGRRPEVRLLDLADLDSVRAFSASFISDHDDLAVLVNNAGGVFGSRRTTADGFEMTIGTNHLGPFLLTELLTPLLIDSAPSRIVNVGSAGHTYAKEGMRLDDLNWEHRKYKQMEVYGHSKLANILHARELDHRLSDKHVTAYSVHPGVVRTSFGAGGDSRVVGLFMKLFGWRFRTPEEGAETSIWAATDPAIVEASGGYFADCAPSDSTRHAKDDAQARALWDLSEQLVNAGAQ